MTEQDKKELIELGFVDIFNDRCFLYSATEYAKLGIEHTVDGKCQIYVTIRSRTVRIGYFESISQVRQKMEGLNMLIS